MPNLCIECGIDMGDCNPRQLCGKTRCLNTAFYDSPYDEETNETDTDVEDDEPNTPSKKPKLVRRNAEINSQSRNNDSNDNING